MPLRLIHYTCTWVFKNNPWPVVETLSVQSLGEAIAACTEQMEALPSIGRVQLRHGNDIKWDSHFGRSVWTNDAQIAIELHLMRCLRTSGLTDATELSPFEIQMLLSQLNRQLGGS